MKKEKRLQSENKVKTRSLKAYFFSSTEHIWKSRLSWKIAANVFLTILIVQGCVLYISIKEFEQSQLNQLKTLAQATLIPTLETTGGMTQMLTSPISDEKAQKVIQNTKTNIQGFTIYSSQLEYIQSYGKQNTLMMLNLGNLKKTSMSANGQSYETVLKSSDLGFPYVIVVRMNASHVQQNIIDFFIRNLIIIALLSGLVTSVLMIALGYVLLEPIVFLDRILSAASKDPENPLTSESPFDKSDEIGKAVSMTQNLIKQNAKNLKQIKSAAEDQIHKLAYFDTLTDLPNRTSFLQSLKEKIQTAKDGSNEKLAVLAIDLDHFKDINDSMGHNVGDVILKGVGHRLRAAMPEIAMVSRSGEDEFGIAIPLNETTASAKDIADKALSIIKDKPFEVFSEEFQIRASIGVAIFPTDGTEAEDVLKNADIALNRSKEEGRGKVREYSEDFDKAVQYRFQMLRDLSDAMENDEIELFYQPQFNLNTGALIGAEGLLRWWKPNNSKEGGTFISPSEFIPVAEQSGLIVPIGANVLKAACRHAVHLNEKYNKRIRIAVNVSGVQFTQSDLVKTVSEVLADTNLEPGLLELEVTESIFMDDVNYTINILKELHGLGVELAIDDFGTGYSSLSYLRQFPIDRLKIDQSFIRNALNNNDDAAITKTIIGLGHSLNLSVIAEGVETRDHETFLKEQKCDEVQGFRYAKPMPAKEFEAFIASYNDDLSTFDI